MQIKIPPHIFDALHRYYKFGHQPGSCLRDLLEGRMYESALRADSETRSRFADIIIFVHEFADRVKPDEELFNFKWETWRCKFSPDATEINFNRGDDE